MPYSAMASVRLAIAGIVGRFDQPDDRQFVCLARMIANLVRPLTYSVRRGRQCNGVGRRRLFLMAAGTTDGDKAVSDGTENVGDL